MLKKIGDFGSLNYVIKDPLCAKYTPRGDLQNLICLSQAHPTIQGLGDHVAGFTHGSPCFKYQAGGSM